MSATEQRKVEEEVVRQLEEKRDARKRAHEIEWFHKVENDEIASDEDDKGVETKEVEEGEEGDTGEENEWLTEDSEDSESDEWKGDSMEFVNGIIEVQRKSGYAFIKGLRKAEEIAVKKEEGRNVK